MLKLTLKAGEYLLIGDGIKVVYTGGSGNNGHLLVDAPKSMNIARSGALEKYGMAPGPGNGYVSIAWEQILLRLNSLLAIQRLFVRSQCFLNAGVQIDL